VPASPLQPKRIFDLPGSSPGRKIFTLAAIVASQQENCATIANYLGIELRYMEAGE
jgi:hypothetical protein